MKKLPIGIQDIKKILTDHAHLYVDKTGFAYQLIEAGIPHYFLSRPRRFGKSLFVSTLKQIFQGNKKLFKGCKIYKSAYDWQKFPVVHFDFSQVASCTLEEFKESLQDYLAKIASSFDVSLKGRSLQMRLSSFIEELAKKNRVVVLIDECDKPIIDNISRPEVARQNRELLCGFFGTLKGLDEYLKFTFFTGVSKFSQASIFSGLNNLVDITMEPDYGTLMGYTEEEIKQNFSEHLEEMIQVRGVKSQEILEEIREWYSGYCFCEKAPRVYNPFSTLHFFHAKKSQSYWYSSGTPSFLIDQVKKRPQSIIPLSGTTASKEQLSDSSEVTDIDLAALMFQTGYLTIVDYNVVTHRYVLGFPNKEVEKAFFGTLIQHFAKIHASLSMECQKALHARNVDLFFEKIRTTIASFPYQLFIKASESTYHGMLLGILKGMGLQVYGEKPTNIGRMDLVIETEHTLYLLELKLDSAPEKALEQIQEKTYYEQFLHQGKKLLLLGVSFSSLSRNISTWKGLVLSEDGKLLKEL